MEDLPLHHFHSMGEIETKIPTEVLVSDRREYELAEEGFIALTMRKGSDNAAFFPPARSETQALRHRAPKARRRS